MHEIYRTDSEIDALIDAISEYQEKGSSKYPGMSYEDGIRAAIDWLTAKTVEPDEHPMA